MKELYIYGILKLERLVDVLALVREVFSEYEAPDYSDEGIQEFMRFIEPEAITEMLKESKLNMWMCEDNGKVIGTLAAKPNHICLLFVHGEYHRQGIARHLLNIFIEQTKPEEITVNSSPYAVEAYRRLGFDDTDAEKTVNGIRFTAMKRVEVRL